MREILQWTLQKMVLLIKKTLPASEEYLASGRFIKPVTNNDVTKWDAYPKIQNLSKKISRSKTKQRKTFLT